jgi:hypothetical protein
LELNKKEEVNKQLQVNVEEQTKFLIEKEKIVEDLKR